MLADAVAPLTFWPISVSLSFKLSNNVANNIVLLYEIKKHISFQWIVNGTTVIFYIDDFKVASKLNSLDRQLQLPNGFKLHLRVYPGFPNITMNEKVKEKMKLVMAKRYNAVNKALDLTKFHADPDLQEFFCVLFKPIVLITVLDIIKENIPELEAINLGENRLSTFIAIKKLPNKIPNVKILHLGKNSVSIFKIFFLKISFTEG